MASITDDSKTLLKESGSLGSRVTNLEEANKKLASSDEVAKQIEGTKTAAAEAKKEWSEELRKAVQDFASNRIDKIKFYAIITLTAVGVTAAAFWHFRGETHSDVAELRADLTKRMDKYDERASNMEQTLARIESRLGGTPPANKSNASKTTP